MALQLALESFHYPGGPELFAPVSLELAPGRSVALVGGSGSGKSSLLTLLAGLHPQPLGGRFAGRLSFPGDRRVLGYLGADPDLFLTGFCATVLEEVGWTLFGWGWTPQQVETRVLQVLGELGLAEHSWRDPRHLSHGQRQSVALAAVWARRPRFLLLDEPASRLDPQARLRLQAVVARLASEEDVAVAWATANLAEVTWCDEVWALSPAAEDPPGSTGARVEVAASRHWQPQGSRAVLPWPLQWARRWGVEEPAWTAGSLVEAGSLRAPTAEISEEVAIQLEGVAYRAPGSDHDLFSSLDWKVRSGECVGLVGINGAGKTTLARLLRGLLQPRSGVLRVAGMEVARQGVSSLAGIVSYTFQEPANLFFKTRVDAELLYSGELLGLDRTEASRRVQQALETFALAPYAAAHPRELPAAMTALLGVALSWYSRARLQILDEPLAHLDGPGRVVLEHVLEAWREAGTTVVVIAHDLDWLCTVCTTFSMLGEGRIVATGSAGELFAQEPVQRALGRPLALQEPGASNSGC